MCDASLIVVPSQITCANYFLQQSLVAELAKVLKALWQRQLHALTKFTGKGPALPADVSMSACDLSY
jgi:hypothetical protein